jgi:hypothetical protein
MQLCTTCTEYDKHGHHTQLNPMQATRRSTKQRTTECTQVAVRMHRMQTQSDVESMLLATGAAIKQEGTKRVASRFLFTIYPRHLRGAHARHRHERLRARSARHLPPRQIGSSVARSPHIIARAKGALSLQHHAEPFPTAVMTPAHGFVSMGWKSRMARGRKPLAIGKESAKESSRFGWSRRTVWKGTARESAATARHI